MPDGTPTKRFATFGRRARPRRAAASPTSGCARHPHPPRSLRAGRPHSGGVGGMDRLAPRRRRADPRPLRGARRPARTRRRLPPAGVGAPEDEVASLQRAAMPVLSLVDAVRPDVLMEDGDKPDRSPGGTSWRCGRPATRPGTCASGRARHRLMLSGDHVLPRITPNISLHPQSGDDPLGEFLQSLERVATFDADEVLPAHEHRFVGLGRSASPSSVRHHEQRFAEVVAADAATASPPLGTSPLRMRLVATVVAHRRVHAPRRRRRSDGPPPRPRAARQLSGRHRVHHHGGS